LGAAGEKLQVRIASEKREGFFSIGGKDRIVVSKDISGHEFIIDLQDFEELSFLEIMAFILAKR